jgi:hypothetical protein
MTAQRRGDHHDERPPEPFFRVVAGQPTDEELAALTVALMATVDGRERQARELTPAGARGAGARGWSSRSQLLRAPLTPGPGAWRRSAWFCAPR